MIHIWRCYVSDANNHIFFDVRVFILVRFQKYAVILTQLLFSVFRSGQQDLLPPVLTNFNTSGSDKERGFCRTVEVEPDLELSGDKVEDGQTVEQEAERSVGRLIIF